MNGRKLGQWIFAGCLAVLTSAQGGPLSVTVTPPNPPLTNGFNMGSSRRPDGATLTLDSQSLILDDKRWMPAMGEFHYARYPESEWREELLKMKAGGIDIVSTYVFWIHHEEVEGQFDWAGRRNLHKFVELCGELGLKAIVRTGPWDHGEVRNGGFPDWLEQKGWKTRSDDTNYLAKVKIFYGEIAKQLSGQLWKDGGPVIGIQIENEYSGRAQHLLTLKQLAREAGLDVPLYTRTGWPGLSTAMPFGEMVPLYGVYAEGFWDRELTPMPGNVYWAGFQFSGLRAEGAFGHDLPGERGGPDKSDGTNYPYLSCEIGGGMMNSYHRRILVNPLDSLSTTLVKLGSGGVSVGYYMYHGGENPDAKLSTLMESQATGMWNDMPVKNYDFQTALGQYGQLRPQYHLLRRLHLFLHEWGPQLAAMPAFMPGQRPQDRSDINTLRWSVRSDGQSGFVFVNNYQRLKEMPPKENVQFAVKLGTNTATFPDAPITIPANTCFIWPFNLDLGHGATLRWATAQPVTALHKGTVHTFFFAAEGGVAPEFAFSGKNIAVKAASGRLEKQDGQIVVRDVSPGDGVAIELNNLRGQSIRIVVLNDSDSLALWKQEWLGSERVFLTHAGMVIDGNELRLTSTKPDDLRIRIYPPPGPLASGSNAVQDETDEVFERFIAPVQDAVVAKATFESIQSAGPAREIPIGKIDQPVAVAPLDADFDKAAVWRLRLPAGLDLNSDPILRFHFAGDVARVTLNGKLLTDEFYNGNAFDVGLRRYGPEILAGDLRIAILPLRKDAPIYMSQSARPDFRDADSIATLNSIEIVPRYQVQMEAVPSEQVSRQGGN